MDDFKIKEISNNFYKTYYNKSMALKNWVLINAKTFSFPEALYCICEYCDGNLHEMLNLVEHLTDKRKLFGRANAAYGDDGTSNAVDIVRDNNGKLTIINYNPEKELSRKGQHSVGIDPRRINKDGSPNKNVKKEEEKLFNWGEKVRELYPGKSNTYITLAMAAIKRFAREHKINPEKVILSLQKGKLIFDDNSFTIVTENTQRVIIINEDIANEVKNSMRMTKYKFIEGIKQFLHDLLIDPINADIPVVFKFNGITRGKLIKYLKDNDLLRKKERISDKDENGNFKTATMKVKYMVPKKDFDRKLRNLYIKMFERNLPKYNDVNNINAENETSIDEMTSCGSVGGDAMGGNGAGAYTSPAFGDKSTIRRDNGGLNSINRN